MVGRNPASVLPAPVAATSSALRPLRARSSISSWWRRGCQPLESNQRSTTSGTTLLFSFIGPLAPPLLFVGIEVAGRRLGAVALARLAGRAALHDHPDQHDEQDRRADDLDNP